jgi:SET domain-containing protein
MFKNEKKQRSSYPDYFIDKRLEIKSSKYTEGLGVYTNADIKMYELVESSPVILFNISILSDWQDFHKHRHVLHEYPFVWPAGDAGCAISHGFGGLYNHRSEPNIRFNPNTDLKSMEFSALRDISAGEELVIKYTLENKLWFDPSREKWKSNE